MVSFLIWRWGRALAVLAEMECSGSLMKPHDYLYLVEIYIYIVEM